MHALAAGAAALQAQPAPAVAVMLSQPQVVSQAWQLTLGCLQLDNAWVFAGEEGVADTVKAYLAMEKKLLSYLSPDKRKTAKPTDISGTCPRPAWGSVLRQLLWEVGAARRRL